MSSICCHHAYIIYHCLYNAHQSSSNCNSDGLILLRLARKMLQDDDNVLDKTSLNVDEMMDIMYANVYKY